MALIANVNDWVNGRLINQVVIDSVNSTRNARGNLVLRANPFSYTKARESYFVRSGDAPAAYSINQWGGMSTYKTERDKASAQARARLIGKLRFGSASMGVTLASASQSRAMLNNRLGQVLNVFKLLKDRKTIQKATEQMIKVKGAPLAEISKDIANKHLEWIFGWVPLYCDIHAAMAVLASDFPEHFQRSVGSCVTDKTDVQQGGTTAFTHSMMHRAVWSTQVKVSNPNLWLLNRLGLINPAVIAWDLVPWSFVVNLFVNVNQVLNSFTDFAGLTFSNSSVTLTSKGVRTMMYRVSPISTFRKGSSTSVHTYKSIIRTLGTPPRPSLETRLPELNLGLAAMTSALIVQQSIRIRRHSF